MGWDTPPINPSWSNTNVYYERSGSKCRTHTECKLNQHKYRQHKDCYTYYNNKYCPNSSYLTKNRKRKTSTTSARPPNPAAKRNPRLGNLLRPPSNSPLNSKEFRGPLQSTITYMVLKRQTINTTVDSLIDQRVGVGVAIAGCSLMGGRWLPSGYYHLSEPKLWDYMPKQML